MAGGVGTAAFGFFLHLLVSVLLGMLFTALFGRTTMVRLLAFGLLYGVFISGLSQFIVLPLVNPLAAAHLGLVWTFFLGNVAYGLMLAACSRR